MQFTKQQIEELRAADRIHWDIAAFDRPMLRRFAIPAARDVNANDAPAKPLKQDLGVARVIAQIGNDEGLAVVPAINRCQCFRARAGVEPLRQFIKVLEIDELRRKRAVSADNRRRAVFRAADIVRDDERPAEFPGVGMYGRLRCAFIELPSKGLTWPAAGMPRNSRFRRLHRARVVPSQDWPRRTKSRRGRR